MKRFTLIAVALLVVAGAAITIVQGEVFSFQTHDAGENGIVARQGSSQGFKELTTYGDYVCAVKVDGYVECYSNGADTHAIVSEVPAERFASVEISDEFACGITQNGTLRCWGNLDVTDTGGAMPQPTASPLPQPITTPDPPEIDPCEILHGRFFLPVDYESAWDADCVFRIDALDGGRRYYKYFRFTVLSTRGNPWVATLESEVDTYMYLWRWTADAKQWELVDENDDFEGLGTNSRIVWNPAVVDRYIIDVTTYHANTLGNFTLTLEEELGGNTQTAGIEPGRIGTSDPDIPLPSR